MSEKFDFKNLHYIKFKNENKFYVALVSHKYNRIYVPTKDKSFSLEDIYDLGSVDIEDGIFVAKQKLKTSYLNIDSEYENDTVLIKSKPFDLEDIKRLEDYKNGVDKHVNPPKDSIFNR